MKEVWKDIPGYEGLYQCSTLGRIKSLARTVVRGNNTLPIKERILKPSPNERGYLTFKICKENSKKTAKVHRIVAITFLQTSLQDPIVNHIDSNILNNCVNNLEFITQRDNVAHGKLKTNKTSKYVGVSWDSVNNLWLCAATHNKKAKNLGRYKCQHEAHKVRESFLKSVGVVTVYK